MYYKSYNIITLSNFKNKTHTNETISVFYEVYVEFWLDLTPTYTLRWCNSVILFICEWPYDSGMRHEFCEILNYIFYMLCPKP